VDFPTDARKIICRLHKLAERDASTASFTEQRNFIFLSRPLSRKHLTLPLGKYRISVLFIILKLEKIACSDYAST
jgi:hypothetical protein